MSNLSAQGRAEKNFRERVYYYKNKHGLTDEQAIEKARNARPKKTRTNLNLVPPIQVPESRSETPEIKEPESRNPEPENQIIPEPTDAQIQVEVDRLKRLGLMTEITCSSEQSRSQIPDPEKPEIQEPENWIELIFCILIAGFASWLLIKSSAELWNFALDGWIKAVILELGICGFSIYSPKDTIQKGVVKLAAVALITLSLFTLYTGVNRSESGHLTVIDDHQTRLQLLRDDRTRAIATYEAAPKRDKLEADNRVRELTAKIEAEMAKAPAVADAKVVEKSHLVELLYRVAFMILNIGFAARAKAIVEKALRRRVRNQLTAATAEC